MMSIQHRMVCYVHIRRDWPNPAYTLSHADPTVARSFKDVRLAQVIMAPYTPYGSITALPADLTDHPHVLYIQQGGDTTRTKTLPTRAEALSALLDVLAQEPLPLAYLDANGFVPDPFA